MKIGLTTTSFRTDRGAERFVINLAYGLLRADQTVHVIGRLEKPEMLSGFLDMLTPAQRSRFCFHCIRTIKAHRYSNLLTFAWGVHRVLKNQQLDIVQGFGKSLGIDIFRPPTATFKALLKMTRGRIRSRLATNLELDIERRLLYQESTAVVVNSRFGRSMLYQAYPDLTVPVHVIHNMIDLDRWRPVSKDDPGRAKLRSIHRIPNDVCVFLHVSTNFRLKGIPESLEALQRLVAGTPESVSRRVFLLLVGEGDYPIPAHLRSRVRVIPHTPVIQPFYRMADVLLHPTRFDSFANTALEAFASGLPVITTLQCGAAEIICQGHTGTVLEDIEPVSIQAALLFYLNQDRLTVMKTAAHRRAADFSVETITEQYLKLYETVYRRLQRPYRRVTLRWMRPLMGLEPGQGRGG
jgi:UDP-glucose:(heptosyl)LPS alpha-1,3-glucosyltransferase